MELSIGLIEGVIFETKEMDKISGNKNGGATLLCFTLELAKLEGCKKEEIIVHRYVDKPKWPCCIPCILGE